MSRRGPNGHECRWIMRWISQWINLWITLLVIGPVWILGPADSSGRNTQCTAAGHQGFSVWSSRFT